MEEITAESHPGVWEILRGEQIETLQALLNTNNPTFRPTVRVNQEVG